MVREYLGETSRNGRKINDWNADNWLIEVQETDVMVFIPQVIKAMLQGAFLPISAFDLFGKCVIYYHFTDPLYFFPLCFSANQ